MKIIKDWIKKLHLYYYVPVITMLVIMIIMTIRNYNQDSIGDKEFLLTEQYVERSGDTTVVNDDSTKLIKSSTTVEIPTKKELIHETTKIGKTMDSTLAMMVISTFTLLLTIVFNPKILALSRKIDENHEYDIKEHGILKESIKNLVVDQDLEKSLQEIVNDVLEVTHGELTKFILEEGRLFIIFAKEIVKAPLTPRSSQSIKIKIDNAIILSNNEAQKLGNVFSQIHIDSQQKLLPAFREAIENTLNDELFNAKNKRFRRACETFLHSHLTDVVREYNNKQ